MLCSQDASMLDVLNECGKNSANRAILPYIKDQHLSARQKKIEGFCSVRCSQLWMAATKLTTASRKSGTTAVIR
jgi:hypothetical protein